MFLWKGVFFLEFDQLTEISLTVAPFLSSLANLKGKMCSPRKIISDYLKKTPACLIYFTYTWEFHQMSDKT